MKALSFSQPWLWAVLHAGKHVENRTWAPPIEMIGQRIVLHAAKSWDEDAVGFMRAAGVEFPGMYDIKATDRRKRYAASAFVGVATIDRVITEWPKHPSHPIFAPDQARWFFGPYGWMLTDVIPFLTAIPATGKLGLWALDSVQEAAVQNARVA